MNPKLLEKLLTEDESAYLEFKESVDLDTKEGKAKFLRELLALVNSTNSSHSSFLVIGVEDKTKKLVGVNNLAEEQLQQVASDYCKPPITFAFKVIEYQGSSMGVVQISYSSLKPHTLKTKFGYQDSTNGKQHEIRENQVFIRRGSIVNEATTEEIIAMAQDRDSEIEQRARVASQLEHIGAGLEDVTYYLGEISNQLSDNHPCEYTDRLIEGAFVSTISGSVVGWLWGAGWSLAPVVSPILVLIVSVMASAFKIIDYGLTRAIINSIVLGGAITVLFELSASTVLSVGLLSGGVILSIIYGALIGMIAGIVASMVLNHLEKQVSR
jgi:hypothetical protein